MASLLSITRCRLRSVDRPDLPELLAWRNSPAIRAVSFGDHEITAEEHENWFMTKIRSGKVRAYVLDVDGRPAGFAGFPVESSESVWSFYIGRSDAPRGSGSMLGFLALNAVFDETSVQRVVGEVFSSNPASGRVHEKLGFYKDPGRTRRVEKAGRTEDVSVYILERSEWPAIREAIRSNCVGQELRA